LPVFRKAAVTRTRSVSEANPRKQLSGHCELPMDINSADNLLQATACDMIVIEPEKWSVHKNGLR
jgi:hypothetical protein